MSQIFKKIIIASENPVKINAALEGFKLVFPKHNFEARGLSVSSGVSDQPSTERETLRGAINRADNAFKKDSSANFWTGMEGGIVDKNNEMTTFAWIVIKSNLGQISKTRTGNILVPPKIADLVRQGKELGHATDAIIGTSNIKQKSGIVGMLTNNLISRTDFYIHTIILGLAPFNNPELY